MKGFVLSLVMLFVLAGQACAEKLPNAYPNYAAAHAAAVKQDKRMFVMLTASWCDPCKNFKKNVLYRQDVWAPLSQHFVIHLIDVDIEKDTVALFQKHKLPTGSVPTLFFFSKGAKTITGANVGGMSLQDFSRWYKIIHVPSKVKKETP
jgi:thioredoxin-related protein